MRNLVIHSTYWYRVLLPAITIPLASAAAGPYSPLPGQPGSTAISASSPSIVEWAWGATIVRGLRNVEDPTEYSSESSSPLNYAYYGGSDGASATASAASVAAGGSAFASTADNAPVGMPQQPQTTSYGVSLGQNGSATLTFNEPVTNGAGPDFAVFGNGFSSGSQEWCKPALVEVSSNGANFFAFPSVSLTQTATQVGNYGELDPTNLYDIAGNFPAGYGTPFDLSELAGVSPLLNINDITQVRILSIAGDINPAYSSYDSLGNIINSPWPAPSLAGSEGFCLAGVGVLNEHTVSNIPTLTWSNASGNGIWTNAVNWNGSGATYADGDNLVFDNSIVTTNQIVLLNQSVIPASVTVNNSTGTYTITGTGGITGATGLTKLGNNRLFLATTNSYTGGTVVNGGTLEVAVAGALPSAGTLSVGAGALVVMDPDTGLLILSNLNLNPTGRLDLGNNGLVVQNGNLAGITSAVQAGAGNLTWNGASGITSSSAATDIRALTAVGVIQNENAGGGPIYTSAFDGASGLILTVNDVLVKYTWYGDANLDGRVDGSDYSLIDNGYLNGFTGWASGDFNYDGVVDGSDYTLIDNAFNSQGAVLSSAVADSTARIAIPEPAGLGAVWIGMTFLLRRRKKQGR